MARDYIAGDGDTFGSIARYTKTTEQSLARSNVGINRVRAGMSIRLPNPWELWKGAVKRRSESIWGNQGWVQKVSSQAGVVPGRTMAITGNPRLDAYYNMPIGAARWRSNFLGLRPEVGGSFRDSGLYESSMAYSGGMDELIDQIDDLDFEKAGATMAWLGEENNNMTPTEKAAGTKK